MNIFAALLALLLMAMSSGAQAANGNAYCEIKVRAVTQEGDSFLVIEPDWCRTMTTPEFEQRLSAALATAPRKFSSVSIVGPFNPDNLADLSSAWASACRDASSTKFGASYSRSRTALAITRAFARRGTKVVYSGVDNFYPARIGKIRAPGCKSGLMAPVVYFRVVNSGAGN